MLGMVRAREDRLTVDVLKKEAQEDAEGMYTLLWRKLDGIWLIVADHGS